MESNEQLDRVVKYFDKNVIDLEFDPGRKLHLN